MRKLNTPPIAPKVKAQLGQSLTETPHNVSDNLSFDDDPHETPSHEEPSAPLSENQSHARPQHGQEDDLVLRSRKTDSRVYGRGYAKSRNGRSPRSRIRSSPRASPEESLPPQNNDSKKLFPFNSIATSHEEQAGFAYTSSVHHGPRNLRKSLFFKPPSEPSSLRKTQRPGAFENATTGPINEDSGFSGLNMLKEDSEGAGMHNTSKSGKSLLEELFPEQIKDRQRLPSEMLKQQDPEALFDPPVIDDFQDDFLPKPLSTEDNAREPTLGPAPGDKTTILALEGGDSNLSEVDFRRVAPKGWHIEEWRGREDPLKIIPVRDEKSLLFQNRYYLVFPDPELARSYKKRAEYLHKLAQTYTPVAFQTSLLPAIGTLEGGEDAGALVREYTLVPPSQPLSLHVIHRPYHLSLLRMLAANGTVPLVHPVNRAGRSVLLWVDGYQPSTWDIRHMIARDSQTRGIRWSPAIGKGTVEQFDGQQRQAPSSLGDREEDQSGEADDVEVEANKVFYKRWLVSFEDEVEARRFARVWHKRPFPLWLFGLAWEDGEPLPSVNTEFMW